MKESPCSGPIIVESFNKQGLHWPYFNPYFKHMGIAGGWNRVTAIPASCTSCLLWWQDKMTCLSYLPHVGTGHSWDRSRVTFTRHKRWWKGTFHLETDVWTVQFRTNMFPTTVIFHIVYTFKCEFGVGRIVLCWCTVKCNKTKWSSLKCVANKVTYYKMVHSTRLDSKQVIYTK